jgi:hypothetical protein
MMENVTEEDYILLTNRVKISIALNILRDVLPLQDNVADEKELKAMCAKLAQWEEKYFEIINS